LKRTAIVDSRHCILLTLFAGRVALIVGLIVGLLLGFLVMIVQIPAGCAGDRAHSQSDSGVTRDGPNNPTGCGANGSATQGALFGIRHARASTERQADYQDNNYRELFHGLLLSMTRGFQVQGSTFRVKDKEGIKVPKSSLKMLIFPNNCQFDSMFWIRPLALELLFLSE
jgi:hypothetical protein